METGSRPDAPPTKNQLFYLPGCGAGDLCRLQICGLHLATRILHACRYDSWARGIPFIRNGPICYLERPGHWCCYAWGILSKNGSLGWHPGNRYHWFGIPKLLRKWSILTRRFVGSWGPFLGKTPMLSEWSILGCPNIPLIRSKVGA